MMKSLPTGQFEWIENFDNEFWDVPENSEVGYFLEVDFDYPEHLHDQHSDLLFCLEHRAPPGAKLAKLLTTFHKKEKYVIHHRVLQQVLIAQFDSNKDTQSAQVQPVSMVKVLY